MTVANFPVEKTADELETAQVARELLREAGDGGDVFCYWNRTAPDDPLLAVLRESGEEHPRQPARILLPREALRSGALTPDAAGRRWRSAAVRQGHQLPPGAMVLTGHSALLTTHREAGHGAETTRDPATLRALAALAELLWQRAEPLPGQGRTPTDTERRMLGMLVQGLTDQAIAHRLGTSDRTVRRTVAQLMTTLGAHSRFEAGVRAVERGWV